MSYYTMLSIYGRCTRQFKIGSWLRFFSAKDRTTPEANCFNSFLRILEMQFHRKKKDKNKQKSHKSLFERLSKNTWKHMELKYTLTSYERRQVLFLHDREAIRRSSHSPIDNCGLFIHHQKYESQVTNYKYRLCSHSLEQSRRQYSFFSCSVKPACGFKQLHNKRPR